MKEKIKVYLNLMILLITELMEYSAWVKEEH